MTAICDSVGGPVVGPRPVLGWSRLVTALARLAAAAAEGEPEAAARLRRHKGALVMLQHLGRVFRAGAVATLLARHRRSPLTNLVGLCEMLLSNLTRIMELIALRERLVDPRDPDRLRASLQEFLGIRVDVRRLAAVGDQVAAQVLGAGLWAEGWLDDGDYMEGLFARHQAALSRYARRLAVQDREDLPQTAFFHAWRFIRKGRDLPACEKGPDDETSPAQGFLHWLGNLGRAWLTTGEGLPLGARPAFHAEASWLRTILYRAWCPRTPPTLFRGHEISNPAGFIEHLNLDTVPPSLVRDFLRRRLAPVAAELQTGKTEKQKRKLVRMALNELVKDPLFFQLLPGRSSLRNSLSPDVRRHLATLPENPGLWEIIYINRLILHDLFPDWLAMPTLVSVVQWPLDEDGEPIELPDKGPGPDVSVERMEAKQRLALYIDDLKTCVSGLIDSQREAFVLHHLARLDHVDGAKVAGSLNRDKQHDDTVFNSLVGRAVTNLRHSIALRGRIFRWLPDTKSAEWKYLWDEIRAEGFVPRSANGLSIGVLDLLDDGIRQLPTHLAQVFAVEFLATPGELHDKAAQSLSDFKDHLAKVMKAVVRSLQKEGRDISPVLDLNSKSRQFFWEWLQKSSWCQEHLRPGSNSQK